MRPSERLTAIFALSLGAVALAIAPLAPAAVFLALAAATLALARAGPRSGSAALARDFFPVAVVLLVFLFLEPVIEALHSDRWDVVFAALDARFLDGLVRAWRSALGRAPAFTDAVYLAYASYYALPVAVASVARLRGREDFEGAVFTILLCFYASFLGYLLFPTSGPRLAPADEARLLGGGAISEGVRAFLRSAEQTRLDAFPSGHTAVSLVSAAVGARVAAHLAPALAAWAAAIVFSTVYIHVHYAVDVLAGAALAALVLAAARPLSRALAPRGRATPGARD